MIEAVPFVFQGLLMTVDEFYCHRTRKLRRWERIGHPLDTLCFAGCFLFLNFIAPLENTLWVYSGLSVFSCVMISKDEWQHQELCSGFENWLHSMLFIIHPVVLIWAGYLWWTASPAAAWIVPGTLLMTIGFFLYQTFYWNVWRRDQQ